MITEVKLRMIDVGREMIDGVGVVESVLRGFEGPARQEEAKMEDREENVKQGNAIKYISCAHQIADSLVQNGAARRSQ